MPLLSSSLFFSFSCYLVIFLISSFLFAPYAPVILRIFPPPFRVMFLPPLILKKKVVSCCFCRWFRCRSNKMMAGLVKFTRPAIIGRKYANSKMQALWVLKM